MRLILAILFLFSSGAASATVPTRLDSTHLVTPQTLAGYSYRGSGIYLAPKCQVIKKGSNAPAIINCARPLNSATRSPAEQTPPAAKAFYKELRP